jgi:uncharacterized pyridoxal phosphate-containing UPF0001 family protein
MLYNLKLLDMDILNSIVQNRNDECFQKSRNLNIQITKFSFNFNVHTNKTKFLIHYMVLTHSIRISFLKNSEKYACLYYLKT